MIHQHKYARMGDIPVYDEPDSNHEPIGYLQQGAWMGLQEERSGWIQMISNQIEGWVREEHTIDRSPFQLHARWKPGMNPQYFNLAS